MLKIKKNATPAAVKINCFMKIELSPKPPVGRIRVEYRVSRPMKVRSEIVSRNNQLESLLFKPEVVNDFILRLYQSKDYFFPLINAGTSRGSSSCILLIVS